jgi:hypothetical protein
MLPEKNPARTAIYLLEGVLNEILATLGHKPFTLKIIIIQSNKAVYTLAIQNYYSSCFVTM